MHIFGIKDIFQIQYDFLEEENSRGNSFESTFGEFRLYVLGNDICEYVMNASIHHYQNYLFWVTDWLCKHIPYIIGYDPFPIPVSGKNALELLKNSDNLKFEIEEEREWDILLMHQAQFDWSFRHSWFSSRGGSLLPYVFFRRIDNFIEISWDNASALEGVAIHSIPVGCELIPVDIFKKTVLDFLSFYLKAWESNSQKHGSSVNVLQEWYDNLSIFDVPRE